MGLLKFTKVFSASDDGSTVTGAELGQLQSDIAAILNAGISNVNVDTSAAIAESKLAFDATSGHVHNGTDANYLLLKHYRKGMNVQYTSATTVTVLPGVLDVGGKLFITVTSTVLDITSDFMGGEAEPADGPVYIYAYNNSGAIGFKMSTSYPEVSDSDSLVTEFPLRYHDDTTLGLCRCIGIIHNRGSISADMCLNFDLSNFACGSFVGDAADEIIYTGWTPNIVQKLTCSDATPASGETFLFNSLVQRYGFITANPQPLALLYDLINTTHDTSADTNANSFYNINAQSVSQAGSFTIDAPTADVVTMWMAWSNMGSL